MSDVGPIAKDGFNQHSKYKFRSIDALYSALAPLLSKYSVVVTCEVIAWNVSEYAAPSPNNPNRLSYYAQGHFRYWFACGPEDKISTDVIAGAADTGDKSMMQAMSQAQKYAYNQVFNIHTGDADADSKTPETQIAAQPQTNGQIKSISEEKFSWKTLEAGKWDGKFHGHTQDCIFLTVKGQKRQYKLSEMQRDAADQYLKKLALEAQAPLNEN